MKYLVIYAVLAISSIVCKAQESIDHSIFMKELLIQEGIWIADNAAYKNENEPMEEYAIEWKLSPLKNSLYGRLYGLIDNKEVGTYWDFHKYWDTSTGKAVLMQIGGDGTLGIGYISFDNSSKSELIQTFTSPNGNSRLVGHRSEFTSEVMEVGSSFQIKEGEWIIDRTYTWVKQKV
jgi:hypothetical protein